MKVTITRNGKFAILNLPCSQPAMEKAQSECDVTDVTDTSFRIVHINSSWGELHRLEGQTVDLDHLNLFARTLDSLAESEYEAFSAGVYARNVNVLRDMINLSLSNSIFTVVKEGETLRDIGYRRYMDTHGAISEEERKNTDFDAIAKEMLDTVPGTATPYGTVYETGDPVVDFFDGVHIPAFIDQDFVYSLYLQKDGAKEYLMLPVARGAVDKALKRLGASDPHECTIKYDMCDSNSSERLDDIVFSDENADIYDVNRMCRSISKMSKEEYVKFAAVAEYMQTRSKVDGVKDLAAISEQLDSFTFAPGVTDEYELGRWLIQESDRYSYDPDLDDYYNYAGFGSDTKYYEIGFFVEAGYVGNTYGVRFDELLGHNSGMGGMQ